WLGGERAYVGSVRKSVERLLYALGNIQQDPIFVGHISDRFVTVVPWAIAGLKKLEGNPLPHRDRMNYYTCALLGSTGEILVSLEDRAIYVQCAGGGIRGSECKKALTDQLAKYT